MTLDSELQGIVRENEDDLLSFARKIYEHGYRQGLAARPEDLAPCPVPTPVEKLPAPEKPAPLFPARAPVAVIADDADESDTEEQDAESEGESQTCDHRVRGSITVAGLLRKIERLFDLARFDIEVVICRRQDPERRRLKSTVHLKNYLRESE
jgi:hypothetical protein